MIVCLLLGSCRNIGNKPEEAKIKRNDQYEVREEKVLDYLQSKGLQSINDTAKWYLYNIYCDDSLPADIIKLSRSVYLASLDLKPIALGWSSDSTIIDIGYAFLYNDSVKVKEIMTKYGRLVSGVSFDIKSKKIEGFISGYGTHTKVLGEKSRFVNLMQPEIAIFVKANEGILNKWYRNALKEHGVL